MSFCLLTCVGVVLCCVVDTVIDMQEFGAAEPFAVEGLAWYSFAYESHSPLLGLHHLIVARLVWASDNLALDAASLDPGQAAQVTGLLQRVIAHFQTGLAIIRRSHGRSHVLVLDAERTLHEATLQLEYVQSRFR